MKLLKENKANTAALITSFVTAGALLWTIYSDSKNLENQVQERSYAAIKTNLENFTDSVTADLKEMSKELRALQIEVAVMKESISNLKRSAYRRGAAPGSEEPVMMMAPAEEEEPRIKTKRAKLPSYKAIQKEVKFQSLAN